MESGIAIGLISVGLTALVKKLGVQGDWLLLVCVTFGLLGGAFLPYLPAMPSWLLGGLLAGASSGLVAVIKDLFPSKERPFAA